MLYGQAFVSALSKFGSLKYIQQLIWSILLSAFGGNVPKLGELEILPTSLSLDFALATVRRASSQNAMDDRNSSILH